MFSSFLNRKVLLMGVLIFLVVVFLVARDSTPKKEVVIYFKNVEQVELFDITHAAHEDIELVEQLFASGQTVEIKEGGSYILEYKGSPGYENGTTPLDYSSSGEVTIDPFYSREKLDEMAKNEIGEINKVIEEKYTKINLFKIEKGKLFRFGDWYATRLAHKGPYSANSDDLKVILEKTDDEWHIRTDPPDISFSKYSFPDIPEDVLREANNSL